MAAILSRQLLRRLQSLAVPKFTQVCSFQGNSGVSLTANEVEEHRKRQLWLKFKESDIQPEDIYKLSPDIQAVNVRHRDRGCFVYVDFASEEIAESNFAELQNAGIWVNYCGAKRRLNKPVIDPSVTRNQRKPFVDVNAAKKLRLRFNTEIHEDEIWGLSSEIKHVKVQNHRIRLYVSLQIVQFQISCRPFKAVSDQDLHYLPYNKVIVEFGTEEEAERHYNVFQVISVRECRAKVYRCNLDNRGKPPTELLIKDLTDEETEESLLAEFATAESAFIYFSLFNQRWARVKFRTPVECMDAFGNNSTRRDVNIYYNVENKEKDRQKLNKLELRMKLKPWHSKESLKQMFRKAASFRFYQRLHMETGSLTKFVFITFNNEEDSMQAFNTHKQFDIQYCFETEYDYKTLVLNAISEWDDEETLHQLFPAATKIYIHKAVSESGERTLRNAFLLFDSEEEAKATLVANVKRRLHYRVLR